MQRLSEVGAPVGRRRETLLGAVQPRARSRRNLSLMGWLVYRCVTPEIPVVFADSRKLAEEWTYRFLTAASLTPCARASRGEEACDCAKIGRASCRERVEVWVEEV